MLLSSFSKIKTLFTRYSFFYGTLKACVTLNENQYDKEEVDRVMGKLRKCREEYPIAFTELLDHCRHNELPLLGLTPDSLREVGLMEGTVILPIVRDVVLTGVEDFGCQAKFVDPETHLAEFKKLKL